MAIEKFTSLMGVEMLNQDMSILEYLPDGIYTKALVVKN
jgi:hypothetical protein